MDGWADVKKTTEASHTPSNEVWLKLGDANIRYPKEVGQFKRFSPILKGVEQIVDFVGNSSTNIKLNTNNTRQVIGKNLKEIFDASLSIFNDFLLKRDPQENNGDATRPPDEYPSAECETIKKYFEGVKTNFESLRKESAEQNTKLNKLEQLNDCLIHEIKKQAEEMTKLKTILNIDRIGKGSTELINSVVDKHEFMAALWHPLLNKPDFYSVNLQLEDRIHGLERALTDNHTKINKITEEMIKSKERKTICPSNCQESVSNLKNSPKINEKFSFG